MNHDDFHFTPEAHHEICATLEKVYLGFCKDCPQVQELIVNYEWLTITKSSTWKPFLESCVSHTVMSGGLLPEFKVLRMYFPEHVNQILNERKIQHPLPY